MMWYSILLYVLIMWGYVFLEDLY